VIKRLKLYRILFYVSCLLVLYTLIGGLFIPLKTGIIDSSNDKIVSNTNQKIQLTVYNYNPSSSVSEVLLSANGSFWKAHSFQFINQNTLEAEINVLLGSNISQICDAFIKIRPDSLSNSQEWLYLSDAFWIEKSSNDTLTTNALNSKQISQSIEASTNLDKTTKLGFPNRTVLNESIRNLLFHVPMWFSMLFLLGVSMVFSIKYLLNPKLEYDLISESFIKIGILNGILGCVTGSVWARVTWQSWWPADDPKLNGVAIGMFMYLAYLILRLTIKDEYQKARIASVYSILIYPIFIALIAIMPKLATDTLHPGSGGSVGFNKYDLDNTLRMFFYPAVLGWIGIFSWLSILRYRIQFQILKKENETT